MGEVYRARDSKLKREVAVKVLPQSLAADTDALARFEREALAVAALSHPNILSIFDFATHDGTTYAVMELLDGETLRSRMAAGLLPVRKAVDYAQQIARGLSAAHGKGIVHRDLKPENVFVTSDGHLKILDFGLARVADGLTDGTRSPTAVAATEPGTVMGTVGYMSPEQVRGKPADHRSDIFSFGAILYEMLSGRRAFQGESVAETMTAIAREDPPEIPGSVVPAGLGSIVHHCLEKNPAERFQTASDLGFALQALSSRSTPYAGSPVPAEKTSRRSAALVVGLLGAAALAAVTYVAGARRNRSEPPVFHRLTFQRGIIEAARFSADGNTIVYSAAWNGRPPEIYGTRSTSTESRALGFTNAALFALSSKEELALSLHYRLEQSNSYWTVGSGTLARVPLGGGEPHGDLEDVECADFGPDGRDVAVVRRVGGKARLEYPIGKVLYETAGWIGDIRVSPAGDRVAFLDYPAIGNPGGSVCVANREGRRTTLTGAFGRQEGLAWTPLGDEVWFTATRTGAARALYAVTLGGKSRVVLRVPGALTLEDIARDGRVLLVHETLRREMLARAPGSPAERELTWLDYSATHSISADGSMVAFQEFGEGGGASSAVYIRRTDGSPAVRLAEGLAWDLSRDGRWVLNLTDYLTPAPKFALVPTGPGQPKPIPTEPMRYVWAGFFPDGKRILLTASKPGHGRQSFVQDLEGGRARAVTPEGTSAGNPDNISVSPDGRFFVARNPDGKPLLCSVDGGEPRPIPGVVPGEDWIVGFSEDPQWIYVLPLREIPTHVRKVNVTTGERKPWIDLAPSDLSGMVPIDNFAITPDGKAYVYAFIRRLCDLYVVEGLK